MPGILRRPMDIFFFNKRDHHRSFGTFGTMWDSLVGVGMCVGVQGRGYEGCRRVGSGMWGWISCHCSCYGALRGQRIWREKLEMEAARRKEEKEAIERQDAAEKREKEREYAGRLACWQQGGTGGDSSNAHPLPLDCPLFLLSIIFVEAYLPHPTSMGSPLSLTPSPYSSTWFGPESGGKGVDELT